MRSGRTAALAGGLVALAAAVGALWWRHALRDDWLTEMRATDCSPLRDLPDVGLQVWGAVVLSLLAVLLFATHALAGGRRTTPRTVVGLGLAAVAAVVVVASVFLATTTPTDANDGLDGSGLPCPGPY